MATPRTALFSTRRNLGVFVLTSAALHGLLFGTWHNTEPQSAAADHWLSVEIVSDTATAPATTSDAVTSHTAAETPLPSVTQTSAAEAADNTISDIPAPPPQTSIAAVIDSSTPATTAPPITEESSVASNTGVMPLNEARERIRTKLHHELDRYFSYPPRASHRGWEGDVMLSLQVNAGGGIESVRVDRSSGYALLDANAASTLMRVGRIEGAAVWLEGRRVELQLPVRYRLTTMN